MRTAVFLIRLARPTVQAVTVHYATRDGTAKTPGDYTAASGDIVFQPGQTVAQLSIAVRDPILDSADMQFFVDVTGGVAIADGEGVCTVPGFSSADFVVPTVSISNAEVA